MLSFFFLNIIVVWSSHLLGALFSRRKTIHWDIWLLQRSLFYFFLIFASEITLSLFHILNYKNLWIFHGIFFLSIGFIFLGCAFWHRRKNKKAFSSSIIPPIFSGEKILWSIVFFLPLFILGGIRFFTALFQVPLEFDNLAYHLPFIAQWFQTGDIWTPYFTAFSGPIGYYPSNFELFGLWGLFPTSSDLLINLMNLPVFFFLPIAIYALAKRIGIPSPLSLLCVAVFMYMPQTFRQMGVPLVDLFFIYTFVSAWVFVVEYAKHKHAFDLWILGLTTGLFVGTKYLGVPYSIPIIFTALFLIIAFSKGFFTKVKHLFLLILGGMLGGGFWYIRNWMETSNPLFPTHVELFGTVIFEGYEGFLEKLEKTSLFSNITSVEALPSVVEKMLFMIGGSAFLIIASVIIAILIFPTRPFVQLIRLLFSKPYYSYSKPVHSGIVFLLLVLLCFYGGLYWIAPYTFQDLIPNVRYAMTGLMVGSLLVSSVFSFFPRILQCLMLAFSSGLFGWTLWNQVLHSSHSIIGNDKIVLDAVYVVVFQNWFWIFIGALFAFGFGVFYFFSAQRTLAKWNALFFILLAPLSIFIASIHLSPLREALFLPESVKWYAGNDKNNHFLSLIQAGIWLNTQNIVTPVAYTGFNLHYPLFGRNLERRVQYININAIQDGDYNDFKHIPESIRTSPDKNAWLENLKAKNIHHIVISQKQNPLIFLHELEWAMNSPDHFTLVYDVGGVLIFEVK